MIALRLSFIFTIVFVATSCGTIDGTDPYALWRTYNHPDGAFHFHCLVPPFEEHEEFTDIHPVLVLDPFSQSDQSGEPTPQAAIRLEAWFDATGSPAETASFRSSHWLGFGYQMEDPVIFRNGVDDEGILQEARLGDLWVMEVMHAREEGTVLISLWGRGVSNDSDIEMLLDGFEPRPSSGGS